MVHTPSTNIPACYRVLLTGMAAEEKGKVKTEHGTKEEGGNAERKKEKGE